jgi:hypothetical protein
MANPNVLILLFSLDSTGVSVWFGPIRSLRIPPDGFSPGGIDVIVVVVTAQAPG